MSNLTQKYHKHIFPDLNISLSRFYVGGTPDEVGSVSFWKEAIDQLYAQLPFPEFWKSFELEIWHMGSPDLIKHDSVTLLDYDKSVAGYQTAAGLFFGNKKLALGVFYPGWQPGVPSASIPSTDDLKNARKVISHEIGHAYSDMSNLFKDHSKIANTLSTTFERLRPNQTQNVHEDFAETYRACLGTDECRGTFSDGKLFMPSPALNTLMRCCFMLSRNLENKNWSNLKFNDSWCQWEQVEFSIWPFYSTRYYALTVNWEMFIWENNTWKKI
jgi:hypothetical protein